MGRGLLRSNGREIVLVELTPGRPHVSPALEIDKAHREPDKEDCDGSVFHQAELPILLLRLVDHDAVDIARHHAQLVGGRRTRQGVEITGGDDSRNYQTTKTRKQEQEGEKSQRS